MHRLETHCFGGNALLFKCQSGGGYTDYVCSKYLLGNLPGAGTPVRVSSSEAIGLSGHYVSMKKHFGFCLNFASQFLNEFRLPAVTVSSSSEFQRSTIHSEKK